MARPKSSESKKIVKVVKKTSIGRSTRTKLSATSSSWPNKSKKRYRGQGR